MQKELPKNDVMDDEELQDLVRNLFLKFRTLSHSGHLSSLLMRRISMRRSTRLINPSSRSTQRRSALCIFL